MLLNEHELTWTYNEQVVILLTNVNKDQILYLLIDSYSVTGWINNDSIYIFDEQLI